MNTVNPFLGPLPFIKIKLHIPVHRHSLNTDAIGAINALEDGGLQYTNSAPSVSVSNSCRANGKYLSKFHMELGILAKSKIYLVHMHMTGKCCTSSRSKT